MDGRTARTKDSRVVLGRGRLLVVAAYALAALLPLALLLYLSYLQAKDDRLREYRAQAEGLIRWNEKALAGIEDALMELVAAYDGSCSLPFVHDLASTAFRVGAISALRVVRDGYVVCGQTGPVEPPAPVSEAFRTPPGEDFFFRFSGYSERADLALSSLDLKLDSQTWISALIDPNYFLLPFSAGPAPEQIEIALLQPDGGVFAGSSTLNGIDPARPFQLWQGDAVIVVRSPLLPFAVALRASNHWLTEHWWDILPYFAGIGLLLSVFFFAATAAVLRRNLTLERQLRRALKRREFFLEYLPVFALDTRRCIGAEALIRWRHPFQGVIPPDYFIPMAEGTGLIEPMTDWVIAQAAQDLTQILAGAPDFYVSVNLAPRSLLSSHVIVTAERVSAATGISLTRFMFELTERDLIDQAAATVKQTLAELRRLGAAIALDDFGIGYSNFAYFQSFELDALKIDRQFVGAIGHAGVKPQLLDGIVGLARTLDLDVIAEGVETEEQAACLRRLGIRHAQGWLFSKSIPLPDLIALLARGDQPAERGAG